jgi:hypothetical protein
MKSTSARAALGGMMVMCEIPVRKPTVGIASVTVGVSAASISKTLKVSSFEREMMVAGGLSLSDIDGVRLEEEANDNDEPVATVETVIAAEPTTPSAKEVLALEKRLLFDPPRTTVNDLLKVYMAMSPSEQIAFGRAIGVERVWLPRQCKR